MINDDQIFTNLDEFHQIQERKRQSAHRGLNECQAAITYGSHWVRFLDLDSAVVEFGRVLTLAEVANEIEPGRDVDEDRKAVQRVTDRMAMQRDLVFGVRHDRFHVDGQLGYVHRSHVWPVEDRLLHIAADAEYDIRKFGEVGRFLLDVAFRQMRAHAVGR